MHHSAITPAYAGCLEIPCTTRSGSSRPAAAFSSAVFYFINYRIAVQRDLQLCAPPPRTLHKTVPNRRANPFASYSSKSGYAAQPAASAAHTV